MDEAFDPTLKPDSRPGYYYVSVFDDRRIPRPCLALGSFATHAEALVMVEAVRALVEEKDPKGVWYSYGTARLSLDTEYPIPLGKLNDHFPDFTPSSSFL